MRSPTPEANVTLLPMHPHTQHRLPLAGCFTLTSASKATGRMFSDVSFRKEEDSCDSYDWQADRERMCSIPFWLKSSLLTHSLLPSWKTTPTEKRVLHKRAGHYSIVCLLVFSPFAFHPASSSLHYGSYQEEQIFQHEQQDPRNGFEETWVWDGKMS